MREEQPRCKRIIAHADDLARMHRSRILEDARERMLTRRHNSRPVLSCKRSALLGRPIRPAAASAAEAWMIGKSFSARTPLRLRLRR